MSRSKKSLKQKLAVALSVVNALNVCAPIALPYVNVARDMSTGGGHAEHLSDVLARAFYGTAQATTSSSTDRTTVESGQTETREKVESGGTQYVLSGGTGIINEMNNGGQQQIKPGGRGTVSEMSGGDQAVNDRTGSDGSASGVGVSRP